MKNKIIIFGATGDLSKRKLLPALRTLFLDGNLNETKIFLLSRREGKKEDLLNASFNVAIEEEFANINEFVKVEDKIEDFINLFNIADIKNDEQVLLYLSLPPENVQKYIELLGNSGFVKPNIKIMIEKPFGYDLLSAQELLQTINKYFNNEQVYKIDHYLMKETIQKMQEFKLLNTKLMDKMNNEYVKEIEIRALENIDIQGRVNFYEQTGALRDFIQSHLMIILNQIICRPQSKNDILLARKNAINNINIVTDFNNAYRAQYLGYKEETKNENSLVETFVKVSLTSNEENWSGVKFTLITGKAILEKETKIIIKFKNEGDIEFNIYPQNTFPNNIKEEILTQPQNNKIYDSYEGIFYYALNNRQENFVLNEEILHSWEVFQKVINYWKTTDKDLKYYTKYCSLNEVENK